MSALWIVLVIVVLVAVIGVWAFNGLVRRRNRKDEAWSQIDVELKRRHDLVPNLVSSVQGYATHERTTFDSVTRARSAAVSAGASGDPARVAVAENALSSSLRSLFAVSEAYPTLRASQNFLALQEQLTATEDKLEYARRYYNTSAQDYDTALETFPRSLVASRLGFHRVSFYAAEAGDRAVPTVDFGSSDTSPSPTPPVPR